MNKLIVLNGSNSEGQVSISFDKKEYFDCLDKVYTKWFYVDQEVLDHVLAVEQENDSLKNQVEILKVNQRECPSCRIVLDLQNKVSRRNMQIKDLKKLASEYVTASKLKGLVLDIVNQ